MQGDGLLIRDGDRNPPAVRKILETIGNEKVTSIKLVRTPLSQATTFLLNLASLGQLKEKLKEQNIDKLFHLSMIINGKYTLDKQEVVKLVRSSNVPSGSETVSVNVGKVGTISEMLEKTMKRMGSNYGGYNAENNNCGIFLKNVLLANGLPSNSSFIDQKTVELFNAFPKFTKILTDLGTTASAVVDRQQNGEGRYHNPVITGGLSYRKINKINF